MSNTTTTEGYLDFIEVTLNTLRNDFNKQMTAIGEDDNTFHNRMIDLVAKYPEHKELIQFTVLVNDNASRQQENYSEIISKSFNDLIDIKRQLLQTLKNKNELEMLRKNKEGIIPKLINSKQILGDIKVLVIALAVIGTVVLLLLKPDIALTIVSTIFGK